MISQGGPSTARLANITNTTRGIRLATGAALALRRGERRRGLMGRSALEEGEALVLPRCRQVHTFGMLFEIDVLFIGPNGLVVRACRRVRPRRVSPFAWSATAVVELPSGTIEATGTLLGDTVVIELRRGEAPGY